MSTNVFIADPVIDQYLHASLQNSMIIILAGLIINGIILIYIIRSMNQKNLHKNGI